MCEPASMVVTKSEVFWSRKFESHEDIISDFELTEIDVRGHVMFVRVEIVPKNGRLDTPIDEWAYKLDQDLLPAWYVAEDVERRVRHVLPAWCQQKLVLSGSRNLTNDDHVYIYGNSTATLYDHSRAVLNDHSTATLHVHSRAVLNDHSTATLHDHSRADLRENSTATVVSRYAVLIDCTGDDVKCRVGRNNKNTP